MTNQKVEELPRWITMNQTIQLIKGYYGVPITRGMVYRRAWQHCFKLVEDKTIGARVLIEKQTVIDYYQSIGITPVVEDAAEQSAEQSVTAAE